MKTSKLLVKQLLVAKYNLTLESDFLIFLNDELLTFSNLKENPSFKKIQKWIYANSKTTGQLKDIPATFPLKMLPLKFGEDIFLNNHLKQPFKLLTIKYANLFIQIKKLSTDSFFYYFSYTRLYYTLFVVPKFFIFKKCILS
jgi:hypothetical protein